MTRVGVRKFWEGGPTVIGHLPRHRMLTPYHTALGGPPGCGVLPRAKTWGLLIPGQDGGNSRGSHSHSLQLHVPREVPEAREDPVRERGTQPGPRAYGAWATAPAGGSARRGREASFCGGESGQHVGWGGQWPKHWGAGVGVFPCAGLGP